MAFIVVSSLGNMFAASARNIFSCFSTNYADHLGQLTMEKRVLRPHPSPENHLPPVVAVEDEEQQIRSSALLIGRSGNSSLR